MYRATTVYEYVIFSHELSHSSRYLICWRLSDQMGRCETMATIVCRSSLLKCDDIRLKRDLNSAKWCEFRDLTEEENARHCILQCPAFEALRDQNSTRGM